MQAVLQPTKATFDLFERWEAVHQIAANYPYPRTEIEEQDWLGINKFLYDDGNKADMKMDEKILLFIIILFWVRDLITKLCKAMELLSGN